MGEDPGRRRNGSGRWSGMTRRRALGGILALWAGGAVTGAVRAGAGEIPQPSSPGREGFMARAFELRRLAVERGDQPFGAVVAQGGRIVGEGISAVLVTPDPTAHAEIQALRDAARRLRTPDLSGCELYGTSRACPMCEAAAAGARIGRMYHGSAIADAGPPVLR